MARKRMLSPLWAKHADLYDAEVASGFPLRVAFAALWTVTDRRGVFAWSRNLKPDVLPYDACDMLAVLEALAGAGFVMRYEVDGKPYGFIPSFKEHQHFHRDEKPSTLPAPGEHGAGAVGASPEHDDSTAPDGKTTASNGRLATSDIRLSASDVTDTPSGRVIALAERELEKQCGEHYPAIAHFLGERPAEKREAWAADLLKLMGPVTGNLPEDLARACTDGHLAEPPVTNAKTLRIFVASCRRERLEPERGPPRGRSAGKANPAAQMYANIMGDSK